MNLTKYGIHEKDVETAKSRMRGMLDHPDERVALDGMKALNSMMKHDLEVETLKNEERKVDLLGVVVGSGTDIGRHLEEMRREFGLLPRPAAVSTMAAPPRKLVNGPIRTIPKQSKPSKPRPPHHGGPARGVQPADDTGEAGGDSAWGGIEGGDAWEA